MIGSAWPLLLLAAVAAAVDWWAVWNADRAPRARVVERVAKPAVLLALVAVALVAPPGEASWATAVRPFLVAALVGSLAGDVLLLPGGSFIGGLVAFLLGHVAYIGAFAQVPVGPLGLIGGSTAAAILAGVVGRLIVGGAARSGLRIPVIAYLGVILVMAVLATGTLIPAAVMGAWLFLASDSMLGWGQFVMAKDPAGGRGDRRLNLAVIVTYHLGQAALLVALAG